MVKQNNPIMNTTDETMNSSVQHTDKSVALLSLFSTTTALFFRLKIVAEQVHHQGSISAGKRGVLMSLRELGPQTVPQLARARPVSRQHIQSLVNSLLDEGHVEYVENPAHKRSRLVRLTQRGCAILTTMIQREMNLLEGIALGIDTEALQLAENVLDTIREYLAGSQWLEHLKTVDKPNQKQ